MRRHCHFCGHPTDVIEKLIIRDDIGICERCVAVCNLIIAEPMEQAEQRGSAEYDSWLPQNGGVK